MAVDGSEDAELSISDLPGILVGDWRLASDQVDVQEVEDPVEIDEASNEASVTPGDKPFDAEYVLGEGNEVGDDNEAQNEVQNE